MRYTKKIKTRRCYLIANMSDIGGQISKKYEA
jgi:hypothetical protein